MIWTFVFVYSIEPLKSTAILKTLGIYILCKNPLSENIFKRDYIDVIMRCTILLAVYSTVCSILLYQD